MEGCIVEVRPSLKARKRELQAPLTISVILVLVDLRLHQIERLLRGEEDLLLLWAPHIDVSPIQAEDEEHDLVQYRSCSTLIPRASSASMSRIAS